MRETWVQSLAWDNTLEKGMATHSSILAWRIPWTEKPGGLGASLVALLVKNPAVMQETPVRFLGQEDPLEQSMAIHSKLIEIL